MKRLFKLVLALVLLAAIGAAAWWNFALISPADAAERIAEIHAARPELEEHADQWGDALRLIGAPFSAVSALGRLAERVDQARTTTLEVAGVQIRPWQSIEEHAPGAELVDAAIGAVTDVVRLSGAIDDECRALQDAANAYAEARAAAEAEPTDTSVRAACAAADALADTLEGLRDRVAPASRALAQATERIDSAAEWLEDVTPEGAQEGLVLAGLQAAVGGLRAAVASPTERLGSALSDVDDDIAALREVGALDEDLRPPLFADGADAR